MIPIKKWNRLVFIMVVGLLLVISRKVEAFGIVTAPIQFDEILLNGYDQITSGTTEAWQVDTTGESGGWSVLLSATDFSNQNEGIISASNFDVRLLDENIKIISGSSGPASSQTSFIPIGTSSIKIISTAVGQGEGVYEITPEFQLHVPAQTFAGNYTSTITVTVITGP